MSQIRTVDHITLEQLRHDAALASRQRLHLNVHRCYEENPQIFYNCLFRGSYMRPHRHTQDGRHEFFACLMGEALMVTFAETGEVSSVIHMATCGQSKVSSVMVDPSTWHTLVCVSEHAMLLEVKPGPFRPQLAKEFAPWFPEEDDPHGMSLLEQAIARFLGADTN